VNFKKFLLLFLFALSASCWANRSPSSPFVSGDGFRAYADYIYDETDRSLDPTSVKSGSAIFVKTDYLDHFFSRIHPLIRYPYVLITHNSDYGVPGSFSSFLEDEKIIAWFGQNTDLSHPKLHPIPIGIANQYWGHGNVEVLRAVASQTLPKKHLLYLNFVIQNYYPERWQVFRLFGNAPFCFRPSRKDFGGFLADMKSSQFILSPRGNGLDTHRLWEALYMGSFPIVKTSSLDALYADLPVVIVNDWKEVTEEFLLQKYEELSQSRYSLEKTKMNYWTKLIDSYKS
jgi:hypothetical protein